MADSMINVGKDGQDIDPKVSFNLIYGSCVGLHECDALDEQQRVEDDDGPCSQRGAV